MDLNKVMLIGRLTKKPESKKTTGGQDVLTMSLATGRKWKDKDGNNQESVEFTDIVAFGKLAEIIGQYADKGRKLYIEGRLQTRNWEAQDGTKRRKTEVVANDIILLDSAKDTQTTVMPTLDVDMEVNLDDIPF